ncbi:MAG: dehydratase [Rhodococcus sp.]|nr:dehydratase [Rhodococcus sp. (in: high G+C Gram-positive bacteria)]
MGGKVIQLSEAPKTLDVYLGAVRSTLPVIGASGNTVPDTTFTLRGVRVDPDNLAAYCKVTGLRFSDTLPLTYPFTLAFPVVMKLMVSKGFPFPAIGSVHAENVIEQTRPISVSDPLDLSVHAENLREHRKGMLIDVVSEVRVGRELVWRQVSSFLKQQRTSLSGQPGPEPKKEKVPPPPLRVSRVDQSIISRYASVSGDRNPIHVSSLGAKAFGFPKTIAHGMWSAATILGTVEGRIPDAVTYGVRFGKPILLPATLNMYADQTPEGWDLAIRHPKKGYPHLTATLR